MAHLAFRQPERQSSRQLSTDPHNEIHPHMDHYIGIDVGTGSARACIVNAKGDIVGLASENIGLWQPEQGFYVSLRHGSKSSRVQWEQNHCQWTSFVEDSKLTHGIGAIDH